MLKIKNNINYNNYETTSQNQMGQTCKQVTIIVLNFDSIDWNFTNFIFIIMRHILEHIVLVILVLKDLYSLRLPTISYHLVDYNKINNQS